MEPDEVAASYDRLAEHWNGDAFNRENGIAQHERALRFAPSSGAAIDIGCGSSGRIIDLMLAHGFDAEGLDLSAEMLRLARCRHPNVAFHHSDITTWELCKPYAFISAWDSVWHVPLAEQAATLRKLCRALAAGGVLITTTGGVDKPGEVRNPCLGEPMYHAAIGVPKLLEVLSESGCVCRHLEFDQWPEPHVYVIAQRTHPSDA